MKVLSLFDGMSCGQIALERVGIKVDKYYASEIDKDAIKVTMNNYPNTIQLGDVSKWQEWDLKLEDIDLIIGGSPCQGFSFAGKQLNFEDNRSKLFFKYLEILNHIKERNKNVKFLLENVKMKKEYLNFISYNLKVEPILINSKLVSAQSRDRYYWTNIEFERQIKNKKIYIKDILEFGYYNGEECQDKLIVKDIPEIVKVRKYPIIKEELLSFLRKYKNESKLSCKKIAENLNISKSKVEHWFRSDDCFAIPDAKYWEKLKEILSIKDDKFDKSITKFEIREGKYEMSRRVYKINGKAPTLTAISGGKQKKIIDDNWQIRELTPIECERLQTVPDDYTSCASKNKRYKMLGNGWTVDVIAHILKGIK